VYKQFIQYFITVYLLFNLYGCSSIQLHNMEIIEGVILIPDNNEFVQNVDVGNVKVNGDEYAAYGFVVDEKLFKQAIGNSLNSYFNKNIIDKLNYLIDVEMKISDTGFIDKTVTTDAVYSLTNLQTGYVNKFYINASYTANLSGTAFWTALLAGTTSNYIQVSKLTQEDQEKLVKVAYAKPNTPLTAVNGSARFRYAVAGGIRANIAGLVKMLSNCKFSNLNDTRKAINSCDTYKQPSKSVLPVQNEIDEEDEMLLD